MTERGDGWTVETRDRFILLRFNHRPDGRTLSRLHASRFAWGVCCSQQCWYAAYAEDTLQEGLAIARDAETWESVGEDAPSWLDDADYPFFH